MRVAPTPGRTSGLVIEYLTHISGQSNERHAVYQPTDDLGALVPVGELVSSSVGVLRAPPPLQPVDVHGHADGRAEQMEMGKCRQEARATERRRQQQQEGGRAATIGKNRGHVTS